MYFNHMTHSLLIHFVHLPGIRWIARTLYRTCCNKRPLKFSPERVSSIMAQYPIPSTSLPCWQAGQHPVWEEARYDLSVIIPFYNTEQYAIECIQSVLEQKTSFHFEIILVDDGSPDGCPAILDSYQNHGNIRVIHKKNGGLSSARNEGLRAAQGRYVFFLDSDDLLCPGAIEALMAAAIADQADIVEGSHRTVTLTGDTKRHYRHIAKLSRHGEGMFGYACGKIYKKTMFSDFCFPEGYWYEDTIVSSLLFPIANVTKTIEDEIFLYRMNPRGISLSSIANPKCIDSYYIIEPILSVQANVGIAINKRGILSQLSKYLHGRTYALPEETIKALFLMAADLVERYDLTTDIHTTNFYEQELCEAFIHRRYHRWKWASILM